MREGLSGLGRGPTRFPNAMNNHYPRLFAMTGLSFAAMYVLMYAMVDSPASIYNNLNQVYMAGLMASPMLLMELLLMGGMYHNRRLNALLMMGAVVAGCVFFLLIRQQTAISDRQFLRSMIPHHSGAILMCQESALTEPRIRELCRAIVTSQEEEISAMKALLGEP